MAHIYTFTMTGQTDLGGYMKTNLSKTKHGTHVHNQETWHKRGGDKTQIQSKMHMVNINKTKKHCSTNWGACRTLRGNV